MMDVSVVSVDLCLLKKEEKKKTEEEWDNGTGDVGACLGANW